MATILNIETSTEICSVTLAKKGELLFNEKKTEGLNHSELLTVFIEELFRENDFSMNNLDAVAVSKGPGSYTGLRIGVSVAKGLCYALDKPLISVGALDAMADYTSRHPDDYINNATEQNILLCPMIDARRMEVYTAIYNVKGEKIEPVKAEIIDENSFSSLLAQHQILIFGNGAEKCKPHLKNANALFAGPSETSARFMQNLSQYKYNKKDFENVAYFEPFYLKNFVATVPKNKVF